MDRRESPRTRQRKSDPIPPARADFVADVRSCLGRPYVWGADGPDAFDCSGLVWYNAHRVGLTKCPRTSEEQFAWCDKVTTPLPGDLVFFTGAENDPPPGHVGVVIAPGRMIDAPHTGAVVQEAGFGINGTGVDKFLGYGRMPGLAGTDATANQSLITTPDHKTAVQAHATGSVISVLTIMGIVLGLFVIGALLIGAALVFRPKG